MNLSRRHFLLLTVGLAAGCKSADNADRIINAGPVDNFAGDGVYNNFCDLGFFVVRSGGNLSVLSAICTHRKCQLTAEPDRSFYCKCHGSIFDSRGHVIEGPAKRDLPVLPAYTNDQGQLIVNVRRL